MIRSIAAVAFCLTASFAYMPNVKKYDPIEKEGKAYYYGEGKTQDFLKAREKLFVSCGVGYVKSCELLSDIYAGVTPQLKKRAQPFEASVDFEALRQNGFESFYYFEGFSPLEMFSRQIDIPKGDRWRLSMKLYPLWHAELGTYSNYLVVADVIEKNGGSTHITRYSTVYSIMPMSSGAMENTYIAKNDLSGEHYPCGFYEDCSNLNEMLPEQGSEMTPRNRKLEKAPWKKQISLPAALIRKMDFLFSDLKSGVDIERNGEKYKTWRWDITGNIKPKHYGKVFQVLTVDKMGNEYIVASRNSAKNAVYGKGSSLFKYRVDEQKIYDHKTIK